jgi:hypothetical protein
MRKNIVIIDKDAIEIAIHTYVYEENVLNCPEINKDNNTKLIRTKIPSNRSTKTAAIAPPLSFPIR